jgi:tRNA(adenine34) deaminase
MLVITQAQQVLKSSRLTGCELYVTVEPCLMCAGAIIASRISRLVYGIEEPKMGCIYSKMFLYDVIGQHRLEIYGSILAEESKRLMQAFFSNKR